MRAFNLLVKPNGASCNLRCRYCYYLDKSKLYPGVNARMDKAILEEVVKQFIQGNEAPEVFFYWHGGEPLLCGMHFYRAAVELQQKYADGKIVNNVLQTNGTLLNAQWCDFFAKENFWVGISLDGPPEIHDRFRLDVGARPSFNRVMTGLQLLRDHGVEFNVLTTVNKASEGNGERVYRFLKSVGCKYIQLIPVADGTPESVSPVEYGRFLCHVFDCWKNDGDVGRYYVDAIDCALAAWCGSQPGSCVFSPSCGTNPVVEFNGDVYSCDHFVKPAFFLGNISSQSLVSMMDSIQQYSFGQNKRVSLPRKCFSCQFLFACNGGCPRYRQTLCEGYQLFYAHIKPDMDKMRDVLKRI